VGGVSLYISNINAFTIIHYLKFPSGNNDLSAQKGNMHQVLSRLPKENLQTLAYIVNHLHRVQQHHTVNKMNASNLSIVFWPTLMRPPLADLADPGKQLGFQLSMAKMIESPDFVPSYNQ
jgi:hypothetical protein